MASTHTDEAFVTLMTQWLKERPGFGIAGLLQQVMTYLHVEALSVFMLEKDLDELVLKYAVGASSDEVVGIRIPVGKGVVGWVVKYSEDLIVPSTDLDPRFYSGVDEKTCFVTRSILCVPMCQAGQTIGAIEAMNKTTGYFNDEDVTLLQGIADVAVDYL